VPPEYDALVAKVIAHAPDRAGALQRLGCALRELVILGVTTNTEFLTTLLDDPEVAAGSADTQLITRAYNDWKPAAAGSTLSSPELIAAALALAVQDGSSAAHGRGAGSGDGRRAPATPWDTLGGWRNGGVGR
jgi:acetyl-CoA/propionyl-CoA carboxylase biotin carboxyl carrier protein